MRCLNATRDARPPCWSVPRILPEAVRDGSGRPRARARCLEGSVEARPGLDGGRDLTRSRPDWDRQVPASHVNPRLPPGHIVVGGGPSAQG